MNRMEVVSTFKELRGERERGGGLGMGQGKHCSKSHFLSFARVYEGRARIL